MEGGQEGKRGRGGAGRAGEEMHFRSCRSTAVTGAESSEVGSKEVTLEMKRKGHTKQVFVSNVRMGGPKILTAGG